MLLTRIGEALYGRRWQSELAHDLGVALRSMQRWVADQREPPLGVFADAERLLADREKQIKQLRLAVGEKLKET